MPREARAGAVCSKTREALLIKRNCRGCHGLHGWSRHKCFFIRVVRVIGGFKFPCGVIDSATACRNEEGSLGRIPLIAARDRASLSELFVV
jgi:hypothetical protein